MNPIRAVCWNLTCFMFSVFEFEETQLDLVKSSTQKINQQMFQTGRTGPRRPPGCCCWRPCVFGDLVHSAVSLLSTVITHLSVSLIVSSFHHCICPVCPLLCSRVPADVHRCHHHHPHYEECDLVFVFTADRKPAAAGQSEEAAAVGGSEVASRPDKHPAADAEEEKPDLRMFPTHVVEKKLQLKQPAHFQELCASQEIKIWPFKVIIIQANMRYV